METQRYEEYSYRIAYEAFSQFSGMLFKTRSFEEVRQCLVSQLKYLFDFRALRISFNHKSTWAHYSLNGREGSMEVGGKNRLFDFEKRLNERGIPMLWKGVEMQVPALELQLPYKELSEIWGWSFGDVDRHVLITLATDAEHRFQKKDVTIMKLFVEILEAKLLELCLFDELAAQNENLNEAVETIGRKNDQIQTIIDQQKEIISEQTEQLQDKNRKLMELTMLNAHDVREPLSRVLGLSLLAESSDSEMVKNELLPKILVSSRDLDEALQGIIRRTDMELKQLRA